MTTALTFQPCPDEVGRVAAAARVKALAITHLMPGSVAAELAAAASAHYGGPVVVGEDLMDV